MFYSVVSDNKCSIPSPEAVAGLETQPTPPSGRRSCCTNRFAMPLQTCFTPLRNGLEWLAAAFSSRLRPMSSRLAASDLGELRVLGDDSCWRSRPIWPISFVFPTSLFCLPLPLAFSTVLLFLLSTFFFFLFILLASSNLLTYSLQRLVLCLQRESLLCVAFTTTSLRSPRDETAGLVLRSEHIS